MKRWHVFTCDNGKPVWVASTSTEREAKLEALKYGNAVSIIGRRYSPAELRASRNMPS